jgi:hypothetical protein
MLTARAKAALRIPHPLERLRPRHPYPEASQGGVREVEVIGICPNWDKRPAGFNFVVVVTREKRRAILLDGNHAAVKGWSPGFRPAKKETPTRTKKNLSLQYFLSLPEWADFCQFLAFTG